MEMKAKTTRKTTKAPYSEAQDDEKVVRNWNKTRGLHDRREYSVAIIRCATCVELVINFAIREELVKKRELPLAFVDKLLQNANGIQRKFQDIYLPIMKEHQRYDELKKIWSSDIVNINKQRNTIVHSGEFRSKLVSEKLMASTFNVLGRIMNLYNSHIELKPFLKPKLKFKPRRRSAS